MIRSLVLLLVILIGAIALKKRNQSEFPMPPVDFSVFDSSEIDGHIRHVASIGWYDYFGLKENSGVYYNIFLVNIPPDLNRKLRDIAEIDDRIVKHKFADTLLLVKKNDTIFFKIPKSQIP